MCMYIASMFYFYTTKLDSKLKFEREIKEALLKKAFYSVQEFLNSTFYFNSFFIFYTICVGMNIFMCNTRFRHAMLQLMVNYCCIFEFPMQMIMKFILSKVSKIFNIFF